MEQYNNFVASLPLLENLLKEREEDVVRPNYEGKSGVEVKDKEEEDEKVEDERDDDDEEIVEKADDDEEEEE
jgi:hypothetical protein